ncbi:MAG: extracellular solute-binding protein [Opitutales bacterium]|nr:extracellular solute-binding protein [Opitutales bacterium]MCH8540210.1 extracellular solute-binding protein [Opitutales bacterium]
MIGRILIIAALGAVVGVPFLLRPDPEGRTEFDAEVVIITPHNEYIRHEFAHGFREWYAERTGKIVRVDWRMPGGTSEIATFLDSEYRAAFRLHWERELGERWDREIQGAYANHTIVLREDPADDDRLQRARRAFLEMDRGVGLDLFFGGGSFDFIRQARAGRLVSSGLEGKRPEWFNDEVIPLDLSGESFRDPEGRWIGAALSSFGLIYNRDALGRVEFPGTPKQWVDLTSPLLMGEVALADPSKSGSIAKAFEMVIQQQMQELARERGYDPSEVPEEVLAEGWLRGLQLVQLMGANARYFTDAATKPLVDVALGDAATGMAIDFYGRTQEEALQMRGSDRFGFHTPEGGSTVSVDPIGLLRGAPNREIAVAFMEYVLSPEGQALWNLEPGVEGGPRDYALRRLPVRKDFYREEMESVRSDPGVFPYEMADSFYYHFDWTGRLFNETRFIIRVMCLDTHDELRRAWREIIRAGRPPEAMEILQDLSRISYGEVKGTISEAIRSGDPLDEVRLAKELGNHFRAQYREAARVARQFGG